MKEASTLRLAYKLLVNDKGKFAALLVGITFAAFLMVQMTSMFAGILIRSSATVTNIGASMWVMDPAVQTPTSAPETIISANIGCITHLQSGTATPVRHWVEAGRVG